ncbi:MAG: MFS transporter, partial [Clostridia bacterium]|nr:MFS transporter [Clostridia bacterium]
SEIGSAEGITKTLLSMAVTGSFITYGTGQIVSGICGDRFSPKKLVSLGLAVTTVMNLLIPFCTSPYLMCAVWCVNGFAQAFMWPPIVKIMSHTMTDADYQTSIVKVLWGSSFGTIAVYLISPLLISISSWRAVFFFSSACGAVMLVLWNILVRDTVKVPAKKDVTEKSKDAGLSVRVFMTPMILSVLLAIVCQGMLRDGVTTWMPSYIAETYDLSNSISILSGVLLPIFSLLCYSVASKLYRKYLRNPLTCSAVIFLAGCVSSLLLYVLSGRSAVMSVLLSAILTG